MKILIVLLCLFNIGHLTAQKIGIINDSDGYTNVRNGAGTNFKIIGQIEEANKFKYYPNAESDWLEVETIVSYGSPIKGYVHKSRIQPYYYYSSTNCACPNSYDDANPLLEVKIGNSNITVCGYLIQRKSMNTIKASEFTIADCETKEVLRFYGAVKTCLVTSTGKSLEIIELDKLPVGRGFQWIQTPYKKVEIINDSGLPKFGKEQIVLDLSKVTKSDLDSFVKELPDYKSRGYFDEIETFIGKLLIGSLKGSQECQTVFKDIDGYLDFVLDGSYMEFYNDCKEVFSASKIY